MHDSFDEWDDDGVQDYLQSIGAIPRIGLNTEHMLAIRVQDGDKAAKDKLIESNLRLVPHIAKRYFNRNLSFLDLVGYGNEGLCKAAEKFDPTRKTKKGSFIHFSTCAVQWIRQAITRPLYEQLSPMHVPEHVSRAIMRYRKALTTFALMEIPNPTDEQLAAYLKYPISRIIELRKLDDQSFLSLDLEQTDSDGTPYRMGDMLEDVSTTNGQDDRLTAQETRAYIKRLLAGLPPSLRMLMAYRYGLIGGREWTQKELAKKLKVKPQRIGQLESKAIRLLQQAVQQPPQSA